MGSPIRDERAPCRRGVPREGAHRVEETVERHVIGLEQRVDGQCARGEECEGFVEAAAVVGEGAGDDELVEKDAVGVEARRVDAGADEHEGAAAHELREAGLHGLAVPRALEHEIDRTVDDESRLGDARHDELVGVDHLGGADGTSELLANR